MLSFVAIVSYLARSYLTLITTDYSFLFLFVQESLMEVTPQGHVYYLLDPFSDGDHSRDPTPELPGSRQTNHTHKLNSGDLPHSANGEHLNSIEDNLETTDKGKRHSAYK